MIAAKIDKGNLNKYFLNIKKKIDVSVDKQYKSRVLLMYRELLRNSPQWSGDFASNWNISHDKSGRAYNQSPMKGHTLPSDAKQAGDMGALRSPIARANATKFGYKDTVYFTNSTPIKFNASSRTVTGEGVAYNVRGAPANLPMQAKVRPVNLIDGRLLLISHIRNKYGKVK